MAGVEMILVGADAMIAKLNAIVVGSVAKLGAGLYLEGLEILAESAPIVPVDTGTLRASGHVDAPKVDGLSVEVVVGYGGASAPYALIVHENLEAFHEPPTQAKYLESVVASRGPKFADGLGAKFKLMSL